jgi:hypothetical protein
MAWHNPFYPGKFVRCFYRKACPKALCVRLAGCAVIFTLLVGNAFLGTAVAAIACHPLAMPSSATLEFGDEGAWIYSLAIAQPGLTSSLELYSAAVGEIDLGAGENVNYSTCSQCLKLHRAAMDANPAKDFYPDQGLLHLSTTPGADPLPVAFTNLRFIEVTIDPNTFLSTPVPGGECYEEFSDGGIFDDGFES